MNSTKHINGQIRKPENIVSDNRHIFHFFSYLLQRTAIMLFKLGTYDEWTFFQYYQ